MDDIFVTHHRPDSAFPVRLQHFLGLRQECLGFANLIVILPHHRLLLRSNEHARFGETGTEDGGEYRQTGADPVERSPTVYSLRNDR
jgi:hypothetical protein